MWGFIFGFDIYTSDFALWNVLLLVASIKLAVSGKQSILSRGIFPGEILFGVVSYSVLLHILEPVMCLALPHLYFPHLMYAFPEGWFLSARKDPEPHIFLLSLEVTFTRDQHNLQLTHVVFCRAPRISNLRRTDVLQCINL